MVGAGNIWVFTFATEKYSSNILQRKMRLEGWRPEQSCGVLYLCMFFGISSLNLRALVIM